MNNPLVIVLVVVLILVIIAGVPSFPYSIGYGPSGIISLVLIVLLILILLGKL